MKKITYTIGFAFAVLATSNAVAQQGFGTNTPDKSSAIEIKSTNKGLLIPRIDLKSNTDQTTINNPANSLLVYNTGTTNGLTVGYYYWSKDETTPANSKWIPFIDAQNQKNVTVTQDGQNLSVAPTTTGNNTDYKVKIVPGEDKQFLATKLVSNTLQTVWVPFSDIAGIISAENGLYRDGDKIKLGGVLKEHTTIDTDIFDLFIKNLPTTTDMTNKVIAVGDATTGKLEVATPVQIVSAGLTHDLTSTVNTMTSTINSVNKTAPIINTNVLSFDTASITTLKSDVNTVSTSIDLKPAIQAGQVKYEFTSTDGSVILDPAGSTNDLKKLDLKVTGVNAGIIVKNGITKDTSNGDVILGGDLDRATTINTNGFDVKIEGLSQVTSMANQVIAVGHETTGLVKVATPAQIVAAGITADNGLKMNVTTPSEVNLGGILKEVTTITTDATNTLAISGLQAGTGVETDEIMIVEANGTLRSVTRSLSQNVSANFTLGTAAMSDYNTNVQEINLIATIGSSDIDITLPAASNANKGQVVNINIANTTEPSHFVNIKEGATILTYGSMPYQGWIVKSNGTNWVIVGRN